MPPDVRRQRQSDRRPGAPVRRPDPRAATGLPASRCRTRAGIAGADRRGRTCRRNGASASRARRRRSTSGRGRSARASRTRSAGTVHRQWSCRGAPRDPKGFSGCAARYADIVARIAEREPDPSRREDLRASRGTSESRLLADGRRGHARPGGLRDDPRVAQVGRREQAAPPAPGAPRRSAWAIGCGRSGAERDRRGRRFGRGG